MTISLRDYWMGRDLTFAKELTPEIVRNAEQTVRLANMLLLEFERATRDGEPRKVNSGWRPAAINATTPGSAPRSKHMTGQAIDISDPEGDLDEWAFGNPDILARLALWQEHPASTKGWAHFQIVPPKSGRRVFFP